MKIWLSQWYLKFKNLQINPKIFHDLNGIRTCMDLQSSVGKALQHEPRGHEFKSHLSLFCVNLQLLKLQLPLWRTYLHLKSTTYWYECLYHTCYKKSLSPWVTGSLYISNTENTEAMQWAKIWELLELKQYLTSKIEPKSSWNADYYFIIRKFPNQRRFRCFPIMPDFADNLKYLRGLGACKSCLFFCLFQREQGLE